jgi:hypothetical protein
MGTGNRGVNDPTTCAGPLFTARPGVVHATVPFPSLSEPRSGAAQNAAPPLGSRHLQILAAQSHSRATCDAIPIARQLLGDSQRDGRRALRPCGRCVPLLDPFADEPTRLTRGERWSYERSKTCDSMRAVPRANASSIAEEEANSNTVSPSVNQRR